MNGQTIVIAWNHENHTYVLKAVSSVPCKKIGVFLKLLSDSFPTPPWKALLFHSPYKGSNVASDAKRHPEWWWGDVPFLGHHSEHILVYILYSHIYIFKAHSEIAIRTTATDSLQSYFFSAHFQLRGILSDSFATRHMFLSKSTQI